MSDKVDSIQKYGSEKKISTADEIEIAMKTFHYELTQALVNIKSNIIECIHSLESAIQVKPALLHSMRNAMQDVERLREVIDAIKNVSLKASI